MLEVKNLSVSLDATPILNGIYMEVQDREVVFLKGANGSGKSTLTRVLLGDDRYTLESGHIVFGGEDITDSPTDERARKGIFLQFQSPIEIEGLSYLRFLKSSFDALHPEQKMGFGEFREYSRAQLSEYGVSDFFLTRNLNEGFSGGERKKAEMGQLVILKPKLAILDEIDSGLDAEGRTTVRRVVDKLRDNGTAFLIISHYDDFAASLSPDRVYSISEGEIKEEG
jgi:Fe-S cluster assembly ATP-binding protein